MDGFGLAPNLVLLGKGLAGPTAETRDVLTGDLLGSVAFNPKFAPVDLTVLPDQDGNGIPELGMLGQGSTQVEILDAVTGDPVNNLWFAERFDPLQVITLPDLNGNGSAEVGAVLTKTDETDRVVVKDTLTDEKIRRRGGPGGYGGLRPAAGPAGAGRGRQPHRQGRAAAARSGDRQDPGAGHRRGHQRHLRPRCAATTRTSTR